MDIPKNYSLVKEHQGHFEIHDSSDGKKFKIAKRDLHPAHQIKIMKLQKLSDGTGSVEPEEVPSEQVASVETPEAPSPVAAEAAPVEASPQWQVPMLPPQQTSMAASPPPVSPSSAAEFPLAGKAPPPDAMKQFEANQALEENALKTSGAAQQAMGAEQAKVYQKSTEGIQNVLNNFNAKTALIDTQVDALAKAVAATQVDPQRFMHSMGTGHKVMAGVALALGALGSAYTKGPNYAFETIQRAIQNDVEAQKADLGKKQSLLSMNLQKYGNLNSATHATLMQMNAVAQGQIAQTAAKYGGTINQANTQSLLGQLKNKNMQDAMVLKSQMLEHDMKKQLMTGDVSGQNPLDYVAFVVPKEHQKEVANELGKAQFITQNEEKMLKLWDEANKEQTLIKTGGGLLRESPALRSLRNLAIPLIHDQEGRVTEFELHSLNNVLPGTFQFKGTQKELRDGFKAFLENKKIAPLAKTHGIDIQRFNSTRDFQESPTKTVNGVLYKRGPNGEAIPVK